MTTPVGHRSSNPYSPIESDTCPADSNVSPLDTTRTNEPLWNPAAPREPAVAPLMDKYRTDVNALLAAWDTPGPTAWDTSESAASNTTTSDTTTPNATTSSSATSGASWDYGTTDTYSSDSYTSDDMTTSDATFTYATPASSTAVSGSSTSAPQTPPPHAGPATADLPNISAGTPPVSQRHHASKHDLVLVDKYGRLENSPGAEKPTQQVTPVAAEAFRRLREYAERDGINVANRLIIGSAFRSDASQASLNNTDPQALANGFLAKAGNSTHRTGNALDVLIAEGDGGKNTSSAARNELHQDPASQWLEANAGKFGFAVLGVTYNTDGTTTHQSHWEPWHITYNPVDGAQLPPSLPRETAP